MVYGADQPYFKQKQKNITKGKVFLEILQNSQGNTCARVSSLIKLQAWSQAPYLQNMSGRLRLSFQKSINLTKLCEILKCQVSENFMVHTKVSKVWLIKVPLRYQKHAIYGSSHWRCSVRKCSQNFPNIYRKTPVPESLF